MPKPGLPHGLRLSAPPDFYSLFDCRQTPASQSAAVIWLMPISHATNGTGMAKADNSEPPARALGLFLGKELEPLFPGFEGFPVCRSQIH